jgi:transcriptional regulator with XRE-family HTH domain
MLRRVAATWARISATVCDVKPLRERVAGNVAQLLEERHLSVRQAARTLGVNRQTLADKLSGHTRFSLDDLELISTRLQVPVAQLLEPPALLVDDDQADEGQAQP